MELWEQVGESSLGGLTHPGAMESGYPDGVTRLHVDAECTAIEKEGVYYLNLTWRDWHPLAAVQESFCGWCFRPQSFGFRLTSAGADLSRVGHAIARAEKSLADAQTGEEWLDAVGQIDNLFDFDQNLDALLRKMQSFKQADATLLKAFKREQEERLESFLKECTSAAVKVRLEEAAPLLLATPKVYERTRVSSFYQKTMRKVWNEFLKNTNPYTNMGFYTREKDMQVDGHAEFQQMRRFIFRLYGAEMNGIWGGRAPVSICQISGLQLWNLYPGQVRQEESEIARSLYKDGLSAEEAVQTARALARM